MSFLGPRIFFAYSGIGVTVSLASAGCWVVLFIGGLYKFKQRGLWLDDFIGLPIVKKSEQVRQTITTDGGA